MFEMIITSDNFEDEVIKSDIPVLVDFWAEWCGPCKMVAPSVEEIAKEYSGKIKVGKVNIDEQEKLAIKYKISSIPTLMIFKNGNIENILVGYHTKEEIERYF